jgi:pimeloyl-ACP methyl ester carboxylesterase
VIASPSLAPKLDGSIAGWCSVRANAARHFHDGGVRALTSQLCRRCLTAQRRDFACRGHWRRRGRRATLIDGLRFTLSEVLAKRKSLFLLTGVLKSVRVPTLVVVGEHNYVCSKASRLLAQLIPDATLKIIQASGHMSPLEQPAAFTPILKEFLSRAGPLATPSAAPAKSATQEIIKLNSRFCGISGNSYCAAT